jgi:hypothetical protein
MFLILTIDCAHQQDTADEEQVSENVGQPECGKSGKRTRGM